MVSNTHQQPSALPQAQWMPDTATTECLSCHTAFSCWNRRHHCRACGIVVCNTCSGSRMVFQGDATPLRVCDGCHHKLHQEDKPLEENCCGGCNSEEATVRTAQKGAQEPVLLPAPVAMAPQPVKPIVAEKQETDAGVVSMVVVAPVAQKAVAPLPAQPEEEPAPAVEDPRDDTVASEQQVVLVDKTVAAEPQQDKAETPAAEAEPQAVASQAEPSVAAVSEDADAAQQEEDPGQDGEDEADAPSAGNKGGKKKRPGRKGNKGKGKAAAAEAGKKGQALVPGAK